MDRVDQNCSNKYFYSEMLCVLVLHININSSINRILGFTVP